MLTRYCSLIEGEVKFFEALLSVYLMRNIVLVDVASQAGDADSSRAPGLTSGLQGSMNVHRGALLLVPQ